MRRCSHGPRPVAASRCKGMAQSSERWLDSQAGPVVRPYAITRGRTRPGRGSLDLIAMVEATSSGGGDNTSLAPEHREILQICRSPTAVADIAGGLGLPAGVVRVLVADLWERGLVRIQQPPPRPDRQLLQRVAEGIRRL
jgi:Protein of unknown function (DUF742)